MLFTTVLRAEQIPTTEPTDLVMWNLLFSPGVRRPVEPALQSDNAGPQITHVLKGDLTLTVDGPLRVFPEAVSDTTNSQDVAPGTAITLHAGDTAIYNIKWPTEFANLGSTPVQVVSSGYWTGTLALPPFNDPGITFVDATDFYPDTPLPKEPVQATLTRVSLPPKGTTPSPPAGSLVIQVGADDNPSIGEGSGGSLRNVSQREVTIIILTLTPLGAELPQAAPYATPRAP
jgi:hypothetical protein